MVGYETEASAALFIAAAISTLFVAFPHNVVRIVSFLCFAFFCTAWSAAQHKQRYDAEVAALSPNVQHYRGIVVDARINAKGQVRAIANVVASEDDPNRSFAIQLHLDDALAARGVTAGQHIEFRGAIKPFDQPLSPHHFDGTRFGYTKGCHGTVVLTDADALMLGPRIEESYFASLREMLRTRFLQALSPHEASMLLALLIGDTGLFDSDDKARFKAIGAEHLLAVSGLQISLLAWLCFALFYPLIALMLPLSLFHYARAATALCASICLFWFVGLADFSPSALRAFLMACILFLPTIWLRKIDALDALCASYLVTILWWPSAVVDLGFILSYAAVFGILMTHNASTSLRHRLRSKAITIRIAAHAALYSLAAFLATLPIIVVTFRTIAPFGVIANTVLVPFLTITQIPAIIGGVVGGLLNNVTIIKIAALFANLIDISAHLLADLGGRLMTLPILSSTALFLIALSLMCIFFAALTKRIPLYALAALLLLGPTAQVMHRDELLVTVMPVGQGDATLFSFDNGQHLLIDAGGAVFSSHDPGAEQVVPTLRRKGVLSLDVLVISHPDPDHILGAFAVLDAMPVKEIWHSGFSEHHPLTKRLVAYADKYAIPVKTIEDIYGRHQFGSSAVHVLAPAGSGFYPELRANDNSLVIRVATTHHALLWPGDLEVLGEHLVVVDGANLAATILKAPHHGSNTSSTPEFLQAVHPEHVIFSTGKNNRFHFPHDEIVTRYADRGVTTWNTAVDGEITITINRQKISIQGYERPLKKKHGHYHERKNA